MAAGGHSNGFHIKLGERRQKTEQRKKREKENPTNEPENSNYKPVGTVVEGGKKIRNQEAILCVRLVAGWEIRTTYLLGRIVVIDSTGSQGLD